MIYITNEHQQIKYNNFSCRWTQWNLSKLNFLRTSFCVQNRQGFFQFIQIKLTKSSYIGILFKVCFKQDSILFNDQFRLVLFNDQFRLVLFNDQFRLVSLYIIKSLDWEYHTLYPGGSLTSSNQTSFI